MRKVFGWILFVAASWMMVSPQALMGLKELKWMSAYAFSGEVLLGMLVLAVAYHLLEFQPVRKANRTSV